ncbi:MAG: hypothetical protein LZF86_10095 [Nitrospira sp.]|nr:MAG: hypothetical protein LZF86_10095 [Nitrospira sp.]
MPMGFQDARHLLSRAGFGGSPADIRLLAGLDREAAIDRLLAGVGIAARTSPPAHVLTALPPAEGMKGLSVEQKQAFKQERREDAVELKGWWYQELLTTPSPLTERMTLFWHNHFTSSFHKVKWPALLYHQNVLLRRHALGSFRDLLFQIAKDPAMVLYLDTQTNRKDHPNENFARELFELFTLGEGHYTEIDIKEAARAFTGWHVALHRSGGFAFNRRQHDSEVKHVLGKTGAFGGEDILAIALDQPACARYLTAKLWREFVSDEPDARAIEWLAAEFRNNGYRIAPLLRGLLTMPQFWAPETRGALVKSPVELLVGTIRLLNLPMADTAVLTKYGKRLGQDLFDPPNVKGWPGGTRWITSATLLNRWQLLQRSLRGADMGGPLHTHAAMRERHGAAWVMEEEAETVQAVLVPVPPVNPIPPGIDRWQLVHQLVMDPTFQLK